MMDSANTSKSSPNRLAIERVERDAWLDIFVAVPSTYAAAASVQSAKLDGCALLAHSGIQIPEFNRAFGFNIDQPATGSQLDWAFDWLDAHASPGWVFQLPPGEGATRVERWMKKRAFDRSGSGWAKFEYTPSAAPAISQTSGLEIREIDVNEAGSFGFVVAFGFGLPYSVVPWFSALVGRPGWRCYLAYDGTHPVACGAMYQATQWAWMGIDATLAPHRGRGAQTALINCRIAGGMNAGVTGFTAETGEPSPANMPSAHSYRNYMRAHFTKAYVRPNYSRA
ncbi:hypothetical protein ACFPL7_11325 [Dongia soli]|uniref:N-acetyltransferase domain-containing protein n=1 Tax=Dongia soli TaxID=600628 RepID=A0ABU5EB01_9PROT|nr:hypothetical protein [Dongia soli]MDY0883540.1 hypothetical protein [Dongia soli]